MFFLSKALVDHHSNITRHVIGPKICVNILIFQCEMEYIILNDSNNDIKKYILPKKKVSMHIAFKLFIG
jgi:hypothetical protein